MRKVYELEHGCMAKAFDNEPVFVLLARDFCAPDAIREWCRLRCAYGFNKPQDEQITEALKMADTMAAEQAGWRQEAHK